MLTFGSKLTSKPYIDIPHVQTIIIDPNIVIPLAGTIIGYKVFLDRERAEGSIFQFHVYRQLNKSISYNLDTKQYQTDGRDTVLWYRLIFETDTVEADKYGSAKTHNTSDIFSIVPETRTGDARVEAGDIIGVRFRTSNAIPYSVEAEAEYCPKMMFSFMTNTTDNHNIPSLESELMPTNMNYNLSLNRTDNLCKKYAFQVILDIDDASIFPEHTNTCKYILTIMLHGKLNLKIVYVIQTIYTIAIMSPYLYFT